MNKTSTSRNIHNPDSVHNVSNTQRHTVFDSTDKHTTRTTLVSPSTFDLSFVTTNNVHQSALRILHTVQTYYSIDSTLPNIKVLETIHEAAIFADKNYGIEAAVQWGNGYTFPPSIMLRDSVRLFQISGYNLSSMVTTRLQQLSHNRLSADRVNRLSANNPEKMLLSLSRSMEGGKV